MPRSAPELQPRLRFPHAGPDAFGPGKAELLRHIAATGSIRTAATELGMSYNRAWQLMTAMNALFRSRSMLLCDREDGGAPPETAAPLRLVAPGDKRGARWARMVSAIEIVSVPAQP